MRGSRGSGKRAAREAGAGGRGRRRAAGGGGLSGQGVGAPRSDRAEPVGAPGEGLGGYGVGVGGGWSGILEKGLGRGDFFGGRDLEKFFGVGKFSVGVGEGSERLLVGARI